MSDDASGDDDRRSDDGGDSGVDEADSGEDTVAETDRDDAIAKTDSDTTADSGNDTSSSERGPDPLSDRDSRTSEPGCPSESSPDTTAPEPDRTREVTDDERDDRSSAVSGEEQVDPDPWTLEWLLVGDSPALMTLRDIVSSVGTVAIIGLVLFAISGVWPPLVAVQSGSMEPHMQRGDLVYLVEEDRFPSEAAVAGTGVVTYRRGKKVGYWSFGNYGNVIVYRPNGRSTTPIIHRARFYVEEGENWVKRANESYLGSLNTCAEIYSCPAPHDGFITKGDANSQYDQVGVSPAGSQSTVVKPSWVVGRAKVKIPMLGYVRLWFASIVNAEIPSVGTTPLSGIPLRFRLAALALIGGAVGAVQED